MEFEYDVALSFAGEDREYVDKVAARLKSCGVEVFYDKFETIDLWGKDLAIHFDFIYRKRAKYCIPFISKHYKDKVWTNHEIRSAISRAIESNEEYILPARFDDTELPGIRPTIGFVDLRNLTPDAFADIILKKTSKAPDKPITQTEQKDYASIQLVLNNYMKDGRFLPGGIFSVNITNKNKEYRYFYEPAFILSKGIGNANGVYFRDRLTVVNFPVKLEYGEVKSLLYFIQPNSLSFWEKLEENVNIKAVVNSTLGETFESNSILVSEIIEIITAVK